MKRKRTVNKIVSVAAIIFLAGACTEATIKAFIGGQVFFVIGAIVMFVATCVAIFITYKTIQEQKAHD